MNGITEYAGVPSPEVVANNLENVYDIIKEHLPEDERKTVGRMLSTSSRNIRAMFELRAADDGVIRPQNMGQLLLLADMMISARLAPSSYDDNPQKVVIGLMKAMEIGVEPISGLGNIMIVNNRPSVWGDLAQALVERSGQIARQVKTELGTKPEPGLEIMKWPGDYGWRVETWRVGQPDPYIGEYTVDAAHRAGLWGNTKRKPWITDPGRMLFNRARAFSLRDGFSDCLFGMGIVEEQRDFERVEHLQPDQAKRLPSPADDDEPVTADDVAQAMPDYGDTSELPLGNTPTGQGENDGPAQQEN